MAGDFDFAKTAAAAERALGLGSSQRHTSVASWDVVREALHDLKIGRVELSPAEGARLEKAEAEWGLHFGIPFGFATVAGMFGSRLVPQRWLFGRSAFLCAAGALGVAVGRERSAAHVEEMCTTDLPRASALAAAMLSARDELEREARTRRYEVYDDIFKGASKR